MMTYSVNSITANDKQAVMAIAEAVGLFEPHELNEMDSMYDACLRDELGEGHHWIVYKIDEVIAGTSYFAPEMFAQGTWNVYFIAVNPSHQRNGVGKALMLYIEDMLRKQGERLILVETSSLPGLEKARLFYPSIGYEKEAVIREFYKKGDDKITFRKAL